MLSTYFLLLMPFAVVGWLATVPEVKAPVDAVVAPMGVLLIVVPITGTVEPVESIFPTIESLTIISNLLPAYCHLTIQWL